MSVVDVLILTFLMEHLDAIKFQWQYEACNLSELFVDAKAF